MGEHLDDVKIPTVRNREFNNWFDNLTSEQFEEIWDNPQLRSKIEDRIRRPGGIMNGILCPEHLLLNGGE